MNLSASPSMSFAIERSSAARLHSHHLAGTKDDESAKRPQISSTTVQTQALRTPSNTRHGINKTPGRKLSTSQGLATNGTPCSMIWLNASMAGKRLGEAGERLREAKTNLRQEEEALDLLSSRCFRLPGKKAAAKSKVSRREEELSVAKNEMENAENEMANALQRHECLFNSRHYVQSWSHTDTSSFKSMQRSLKSAIPVLSNPWVSDLPAPVRPANLREKSATHYDCCEKLPNGTINARCHLTGVVGDRKVVTMAHLLPRNAPKNIFEEYEVDMDGVRNTIILAYNIEKAFDNQELSFLIDPDVPGQFSLKIWNKKTRNKRLFDGQGQSDKRTIGSFEGKHMQFAEDKMPYTRILSLHTQCSYENAKLRGWISCDEPQPETYGSPLRNDSFFMSPDVDADSDSPGLQELREGTTMLTAISSSSWNSPNLRQ